MKKRVSLLFFKKKERRIKEARLRPSRPASFEEILLGETDMFIGVGIKYLPNRASGLKFLTVFS